MALRAYFCCDGSKETFAAMGSLRSPVDEDEINSSFVEDDGHKNTVGSKGNYRRLDNPLERVVDILFGCGAGQQSHRLEQDRPWSPPKFRFRPCRFCAGQRKWKVIRRISSS